jgi:hypothetical protein
MTISGRSRYSKAHSLKWLPNWLKYSRSTRERKKKRLKNKKTNERMIFRPHLKRKRPIKGKELKIKKGVNKYVNTTISNRAPMIKD